MKKRFYETEKMYKRRCDLVDALHYLDGKKRLWRIDAIEMKKNGDGWRMGALDHFTVEAVSEEMAIGIFKYRNNRMGWFITGVQPETVSV